MFNEYFYHRLIRKYVVLFGTLFNSIEFQRTDGMYKVPVVYAPKEKMWARITQDAGLDRGHAILLPRISYMLEGVTYDPPRKLNTMNYNTWTSSDKSKGKQQYFGVPYNFSFSLNIYAKNAEDATKIVEQILPYFTPDYTPSVTLIPEMELKMDIPIVLESVTPEDSFTGNFAERRQITWTLKFVLKGWLFGPVAEKKIIKFIDMNYYIANTNDIRDSVGNTAISEQVKLQPGLTANGQPTSNSSLSIPVTEINMDDDFGYVEEIISIEEEKDE